MSTKNKPETIFVDYPGAPMRLGKHIYILAPLAFGAGMQVFKQAQEMDNKTQEEVFETMAKTIHQSLLRNYPDITYEQLTEELLDTWNFREAYELVVNATGILCAPTAEVPTPEKYQSLLDARWTAMDGIPAS